jgi:KaiC domain protein
MSENDDDDWFERALGENSPEDAFHDWDEWAGEGDESGDSADTGDEPSTGDAAEPADDDRSSNETRRQTDGDGSASVDGADGDGLFDDDFSAAMNDAPDLDGPGSGPGSQAAGRSGGTDGAGAFGAGEGGDFGMSGDLDVDDDFSMGGGDLDTGGGGSDGFGMGGGDFGMGGGGSGGFEADEEYDTDLARIDLGIDGLDEMIQGGVPERSLMVTIGSAGTGKTTFGLQFLHHALQQGERGIYITLEESRERVINSATEKGLAFDEYAENGQLAVVDLDPVEMANSLRSIRSELPRLIESFDATRLVLDSVSLLEMMYEDRAKRRNEIFDFTRSLKNAGVTTMLTSEASDEHAYTSRHGIVEYLTDAVFVLQYVRPDDFRETRLAIEIQKIRDANHSRETKPYEITNDGLSVYRQANIF